MKKVDLQERHLPSEHGIANSPYEGRGLDQQIRRKLRTRIKPSGKIYSRKKDKIVIKSSKAYTTSRLNGGIFTLV